jgi:hypothetical protein
MPIEEPLAELERELIRAYVAGCGQEVETLFRRHEDDDARRILTAASAYATARLTEVESRWHYLRSLRGQA